MSYITNQTPVMTSMLLMQYISGMLQTGEITQEQTNELVDLCTEGRKTGNFNRLFQKAAEIYGATNSAFARMIVDTLFEERRNTSGA